MADSALTGHYEILVRQPSGWMLEAVAPDRASATARANASPNGPPATMAIVSTMCAMRLGCSTRSLHSCGLRSASRGSTCRSAPAPRPT